MKTNLLQHSLRRMICALGALALTAAAAPPVVKTVPWVASNPLIPHTTYSGKAVTLKGACDQQGAGIQWTWDFGDGSPVATGTVTDRYAIGASHVYTGPVGTVYTARLTVQDTFTGETGSKAYYIQMEDRTLPVEVNVAIDEGLWYLHRSQRRFTSGGVDYGDWTSGYAASGYVSVWACNVNAFEVNGHLETGDSSNPYTETVARGLRRLFAMLSSHAIGMQSNGLGTFNPDSNGNGIGLYVTQGYSYYQGGMVMDAIVASGTPNAVTTTGSANIIGRTYADIVQDMADDHAWAQYDGSMGGGWRYNANDAPDNSACQWAAIGLIAAQRNWGLMVPSWVKQWNVPWLRYSQASSGAFGYTYAGYYAWGAYATTPSGMVQMALDGIGRDMVIAGGPSWDNAETFMYNDFVNNSASGAYYQVKDYYYGMFSFVKSMLLHQTDVDNDGDLDPVPITFLRRKSDGAQVDWYAAQRSVGDPTDGVARTLLGDQSASGYWYGHNYSGDQYPFETAWAIMMLHRTLFESGAPVAVAKAVPNPAVVGQSITLDGSDSYHQDPTKNIVSWEWDANSDGIFEASGPFVTTSFASLGLFPVTLRVMDDNNPAKIAETILTVMVTTPPVAPTADADGPYVFCPNAQPWFLDGRRSVNPDEGRSEPHDPPYPGDTIQEYAWDLDGDGQYDDAFGPTPEVTAYFTVLGPGSYLVGLRVTDTSATSYPSFPGGNLSDTVTAQVFILAADDPDCGCVTLTATPGLKQVELSWTEYMGASSYNVYRSLISGGPYIWIGNTSETTFVDNPGVLDRVYYYVVRPAALNGDELCQSNQVEAEPLHPEPTLTVAPVVMSNLAKYYYQPVATSPSFGSMQLSVYVRDTASSMVAGPFPNRGILYIRTGYSSAMVRLGTGDVVAYIMVRGHARVSATDPIGQTSAEVIVP